jgi:hypothetical protein
MQCNVEFGHQKAFDLGLRKTVEQLVKLTGRRALQVLTDLQLPDRKISIACIPKYFQRTSRAENLSPVICNGFLQSGKKLRMTRT